MLQDFVEEKPITSVRIDPGQAKGEIRISAMQIHTGVGKKVYSWSFQSRHTGSRDQ